MHRMEAPNILKTGDWVDVMKITEQGSKLWFSGEYLAETTNTWVVRVNTGAKLEIRHIPKSKVMLVQDGSKISLKTNLVEDVLLREE